MGTRNRERRAAKKKARDRRSPHEHRADFDADPYAPPPAEVVGNSVLDAAYRHAGGDPEALADCVTWLRGRPVRVADTGVEMALLHTVSHMWRVGWLPYDIVRHLGKQLGEPAVELVTDVIATDAAQYAEATVHERWREQLRQIDAAIWWDSSNPHLSQWIERRAVSRGDALTLVLTVIATIMMWPELPMILPPPGAARAATAPARHGVDPKILARVRGLLAKAESTEFAEEAEALSAKAQELMNRHAVERAMLDAEEHVPQVATARRIWLDSPYVAAKAQLVGVVAGANRCRTVIHEKIGFVALMGDEMDLEITELLATSLLLQATRALVAAGRAEQARIRSYRQSFLMAYAHRVGERLAEVTESAVSEHDDRLLPVLVDRRKAVDELVDTLYPATRVKSYSASNAAGWGAGRAAADHADLGLDRKGLPGSQPVVP
ncbi:DUF2786 domain-containing protein [Kutzneria sp. NPDC051319]|uniref:DUF2786 domain-containing protein n=1 Tax=Kutzneria sp. NPDC051319 TaxID=3155047 RepID=UPI00343D7C69